jgi:hypothetical protein
MEKNVLLIDDEAALRRYVSMGLMQGVSFSEIENTIRTKFKTLDNVQKIKEWSVLTLFEA